MPTDSTIHRAMIQAGSATKAAQHFTKLTSQHLGSMVIDQHDMKSFWSIDVAFTLWPTHQAGVVGKMLTRSTASQQSQQAARILQTGHDLLDTDYHNLHLWQN